MALLVENIRLEQMSISGELKGVWLTYTSDKDDLHPLFAVLGIAREYMNIIRGIFK